MLLRHFDQMDARAVEFGTQVVPDAFVFSLAPDCSVPMPSEHVTKQVAKLKEQLGIANKRPATIALEDEALKLFRQPPPPRPAGRRGPPPKGGMSYEEIGTKLDRSAHWVKKALASAELREQHTLNGDLEVWDGSVQALRRFTTNELLDAGFSVKVAADRQGHSPETINRHYAQRRKSADVKAADHLGRVVHRARRGPDQPDHSL